MEPSAPAVVRSTSLERDPMKRDFKNMLWRTWKTWFDNPPTERMYEVADWLQHGPDKLEVLGFRGLSKSYITVDYCAWTHHCDPEALVLNLAGSGNAAVGNAALYWGMIHTFDWLEHLKPRGIDRASTLAFDVNGSRHEKSESFASFSIFSGDKTGRRCDIGLADDIETPTTSATEKDRYLLRQHWSEVGGAILRPGGRLIMLGTPQTEHTLYSELAMDKGYALRIWPVVYPRTYINREGKTVNESLKYGPWLSPAIRTELEANPLLAGTPTEPTRFPEEEIARRRLEYGSIEFDRQFRLFMDAGVGSEKPLHLADCPVVVIPRPTLQAPLKVPSSVQYTADPARKVPELEVDALDGDSTMYFPMDTQAFRDYWQPPEGVVMWVDPSGTGKDETAWEVVAQHGGIVFALHGDARLEGFTSGTLEAIAKDAKAWGVNKLLIEKNYGGGMFTELLRPKLQAIGYGCTIEEQTASGVMKEQRIVDSLETLVSEHRLVFNLSRLKSDYNVSYPSVEDAKQRFYRLTYQFTRISKQKGALAHDDRLDALAGAARSFIGSLRRVIERAAEEAKEAWLDNLIKGQLGKLREVERYGLTDPARGFRLGGTQRAISPAQSPYFRGRFPKA